MSASQQSRFNNFLLADTFGPLKFKEKQREGLEDDEIEVESDVNDLRKTTRNYYGGTGNVNPVYMAGPSDPDVSSTQSSVAELTAAQEAGIRTQFRVIPEQSLSVSNGGKGDEEQLEQALQTASIHVRGVHGDIENDTPASTASSTQRFFLSKGGKPRDFNVGNLQNNHLDKTMRDYIREQEVNRLQTLETRNEKLYSGEITDDTIQGDYMNIRKERKTYCLLKFSIFVFVLVALLGGIFVTVYLLKADNPDRQTGQLIVTEKPDVIIRERCPPVNVSLRYPIKIDCFLVDQWFLQPALLRMTPPPYLNKGEPIILDLKSRAKNMSWSAVYDTLQTKLFVSGPDAICSSAGEYKLELMNSNYQAVYNTSVKIHVVSEVLKVNVSLTQSLTDDDTAFKIACQTNSGCEQSFVDFFAEINKEEQYLRGVNFSCIITYNDYDGYSVSCTGRIPDYLMTQFERITCRPRSKLLDELDEEEIKDLEEYLELPECNIANHCGFKCNTDGDYFLVNAGRCDIFHRCYGRQVYTSYCAPGTYFDPSVCSCRHTNELNWCQDNGAVKPGTDATSHTCELEP